MKALGIIAMIFSVVAIFVPVIGPYLTIVGGLLAAFAVGPGLTFGIVAIGINVLNIVFLSPSLWLSASVSESEHAGSGGAVLLVGVFLIFIQVLASIVIAVTHIIWKKKHRVSQEPSQQTR